MKKIGSVISLLFIFLFLLVSNVNSSSDWVKYKDNDQGVYSYKKVKIQKDNGRYIIQVWSNVIFSHKGRKNAIQIISKSGSSTKGWDKLSRYELLTEQDCKNKRYRELSLIVYDSDGKVLRSENYKTDWKYIIPDSKEEVSHKIFCK